MEKQTIINKFTDACRIAVGNIQRLDWALETVGLDDQILLDEDLHITGGGPLGFTLCKKIWIDGKKIWIDVVKAPKNPIPYWGGVGWSAGAFGMIRIGRKKIKCEFCGTQQTVPFFTVGKTAGRALRKMRRALKEERIPVS